MKDTLGDSLAVTQVDEDDAAMVTGGVHPADECDGLVDVGFAEFVTMMSAHVRENLRFEI